MFRTPYALFRTLAIAEMFSWALLISGLILRATLGWDVTVSLGGAIHGFIFISYGATAILVAINNRWSLGVTALAVGSAVIPFATVPVERWLYRRALLGGQWRTVQTDDPRDARWFDRLARWFFARPWVLAALVALAVVTVFVTLLVVGPPGGRH